MYFGASVAASAASAAMCLRSPAVMNMVMRQGWVALGVSMLAMIGSGVVLQSIPYKEGFGAKQVAWLVHTGIVGAVLAPLYLLGGPLILRAGWYTAGVVGGLSVLAVSAPSEKFLMMGGPLAIGLGVVFASSVGSMFLPPTTVVGSIWLTCNGSVRWFNIIFNVPIVRYAKDYQASRNSSEILWIRHETIRSDQ